MSQTDICMVIGNRGSGKSELMKFLLRQYQDQGYKILIYDSEKEHSEFPAYRPKDLRNIEEFERINKKVFAKGNMIYAIESINFLAPPQKPLPFHFSQIIHHGRKKKIGVIMTTRRIADVHKTPCSQAKYWFIFYTFLPNDVKYLKQFVGEISEKAKEIPEFHFILWTKGEGEICEPISI